jgi:hypothetical protein
VNPADNLQTRAVALAEDEFIKVLGGNHSTSQALGMAFAAACVALLGRLQRAGECEEIIEGVRSRCNRLARTIPVPKQ